MSVSDIISSTRCQSDCDLVEETVLAEAVVLSCDSMESVIDLLVLTSPVARPTAVLFSVF